MTAGKFVRLFLVDGTPGGLLTAEIMNWTGHVIAAPRSDLADLLKRPEVCRTGIYVLLGDAPDAPAGQIAYIGESDDVSKRLHLHARPSDQGGKEFWNRVVVLTNKDSNLTKAHTRYLESSLITLAQEAKRATLDNGTAPPLPELPEADVSDMRYYLEQVMIVLPVLGVDVFRSTSVATAHVDAQSSVISTSVTSPEFELRVPKHGIKATAQEVDGEFVVRYGSSARKAWTGNDGGYSQIRNKLAADGTLKLSVDGKTLYFTHDQVFSSPSAAAAVVCGYQANGRLEWKITGSKQSYGAWQAQLIEDAAPEATGK